MKHCKYCGAELPDDAKACSNCGRLLISTEDDPAGAQNTEAGNAEQGSSQPQPLANVNTQTTGGNDGQHSYREPNQNPAGQNADNGAAQASAGQTSNRTAQHETEKARGYWQYGQWHPLEDLNKNSTDSQNQGYWQNGRWHAADEASGQNQWNGNASGQQGWNNQQQNNQNAGWNSQNGNNWNNNQQNNWNGQQNGQGSWNNQQNNQSGWNGQSGNNWNGNQQNNWNGQNNTGWNNNQNTGWNNNQSDWNGGYNSWTGQQNGYYGQKNNGFAIASLVLGLISLMLGAFIVPQILAIAFGIVALVQMQRHPGVYRGKWAAIIGIITGVAFLILYIYAYSVAARLMQDPTFQREFQRYIQELSNGNLNISSSSSSSKLY